MTLNFARQFDQIAGRVEFLGSGGVEFRADKAHDPAERAAAQRQKRELSAGEAPNVACANQQARREVLDVRWFLAQSGNEEPGPERGRDGHGLMLPHGKYSVWRCVGTSVVVFSQSGDARFGTNYKKTNVVSLAAGLPFRVRVVTIMRRVMVAAILAAFAMAQAGFGQPPNYPPPGAP